MKMVIKNLSASILPQLMNIISNLILPTFFIMRFGSEVNGLVNTIRSILSYISLMGSGIAIAVTQSLYTPLAERDNQRVMGMLHAADNMFNRYGILYCVIVAIVSVSFPLFIHSYCANKVLTCLMLVMSISGASEFFVVGRCRSLLYADKRTYVCTIVQAISILVSLLFALLMFGINANIILVQFSISFVYIARAVFLSKYVYDHYEALRGYRKIPPINAAVKKKDDALIHQLSGLAVLGSQNIILTVFDGLQAASVYSVYNIVFSGLQSICANLCTAVTPFLGHAIAKDEKDELRLKFDVVEFAFFSCVAVIYSVAIALIIPFIRLYTQKADIDYIYPVFATLFVFSSAFYILKLPCSAMINAAGKFYETRRAAICEGSMTVVLSSVFVHFFGLTGVVMGSGIAQIWRCIDMITFVNREIIQISRTNTFRRLFRVIIMICLFGIVQYKRPITTVNYVQWVQYGILLSALAVCLVFIVSVVFERKTIGILFRFIKEKNR